MRSTPLSPWIGFLCLSGIFLLLVGFAFHAEWHGTGSGAGFPLDDAWIHMAMGRNLAAGDGLGINPGEPCAASTSLLWTIWIAFLHRTLLPWGVPAVVLAVKGSGVFLGLMTLGAGFHLTRTLMSVVSPAESSRTGESPSPAPPPQESAGQAMGDPPAGEGLPAIWLALVVWGGSSVWPLVWGSLSGMEVPLTTALCGWGLAFQLQALLRPEGGKCFLAAGFCWGLSVVARPENALLAGGMLVLLAAGRGKTGKDSGGSVETPAGEGSPRGGESPAGAMDCNQGGLRVGQRQDGALSRRGAPRREGRQANGSGVLRRAFLLAAVGLPPVLAQAAAYWFLAGAPFPSTLPAKMTGRALPLVLSSGSFWNLFPVAWASAKKDLGETLLFLLGENAVAVGLLLAAPWFWWQLRRHDPMNVLRPTLGWAWSALPVMAVAVGWVAGPEFYAQFHGRYLAQTALLAAWVTFGLAGAWWLPTRKPGWLPWVLVGVLFFSAEREWALPAEYAEETAVINQLQVGWGRWLGEVDRPGKVVATNDIGAVAYFGRCRVLDTEGLATPEAIGWKRAGRMDAFLEAKRPDRLLIFPYWYPEILGKKEIFRPVLQRSVRNNPTGGGDSLVLFQMPWSPSLPDGVETPAGEGPRR